MTMVAFEVQKKAEFMIHQVTSIEVASKQSLSSSSPTRRIGFNNMGHPPRHISEANQSHPEHYPHHSCNSSDVDSLSCEAQPLADDLSSDGSTGADAREGFSYDDFGLNLLDWHEAVSSRPEVGSVQSMYESYQRCKQAMHEILVNADLKMRKLQYEVYMLQRVNEDSKLSLDGYEQKIHSLERQLLGVTLPIRSDDTPNYESDPADLRRENHLNKLLSSRNKALDENLKLKKQLLSCCSKCRSRILGAKNDLAASLDEKDTQDCFKTQQQPHVAPLHRPTFQNAAHAMVRRLGQRMPNNRQHWKTDEEKKDDSSLETSVFPISPARKGPIEANDNQQTSSCSMGQRETNLLHPAELTNKEHETAR